MAPFSYNKLDPQRREIRLCILHPGSLDDPLQCTLSTVSLDDKACLRFIVLRMGRANLQ